MVQVQEFTLERYQSLYENRVKYNLSESGVEPLPLSELLTADEQKELLDKPLVYAQTNGMDDLRATIAGLYKRAKPDNVLVTSGSAEANFLSMWNLLGPGDEIVLTQPNYQQIWGIARSQGAIVKPWKLREANEWTPDPADLDSLVTERTKVIAVCNPNNPTGSVTGEKTLKAAAKAADRVGAVLYADEVYRGAERNGELTPTCHRLAKKTIVTAGLSKAYGLPGLRVGWLVGSEDFISEAWSHHDYTTISAATPSQMAARAALRPENRKRLLERTRNLINTNAPIVEDWVREHGGRLHLVPPKAGAMAFVRYDAKINSTQLAETARKKQDLLLVAGDCYGMDGYFRLGIGGHRHTFEEGLRRLSVVLKGLK